MRSNRKPTSLKTSLWLCNNQCSKNKTILWPDPDLSVLLHNFITNVDKKKSKIRCYYKESKNRTNSVKSLPEKITKRKIINRSMIFFWILKKITHYKHVFSPLVITKKTLEKSIQLFFDWELSIAQGLSFCYALSKITWKKHKDFDNYLFDKKKYVNQSKKSPQVPKKQ